MAGSCGPEPVLSGPYSSASTDLAPSPDTTLYVPYSALKNGAREAGKQTASLVSPPDPQADSSAQTVEKKVNRRAVKGFA